MGDNLIDSEPAALKPWLNIDSPVYSHCQCRWPNGQKESKYKYKEKKQIQIQRKKTNTNVHWDKSIKNGKDAKLVSSNV